MLFVQECFAVTAHVVFVIGRSKPVVSVACHGGKLGTLHAGTSETAEKRSAMYWAGQKPISDDGFL